MSGQLVGEVLDARAGHLADLSQAQTLALVAIAEKCHADSRQGSVRLAHIQAAIGKSQRTAIRALEQLKERGLIRVVKRGYRSHGVARANVYELSVLATQRGACATQGGVSTRPVDALVVTPPRVAQASDSAYATLGGASTTDVLTPNPDVLTPNRDVLAPPMGGIHDGYLDGEDDGAACAREATPTSDRSQSGDDPLADQSTRTKRSPPPATANAAPQPRPEPPRRCPKHINWDTRRGAVPSCPECRDRREAHTEWLAATTAAQKAVRAAARAALIDCDECDDYGWVKGTDGKPAEPARRCAHPNVRRSRVS